MAGIGLLVLAPSAPGQPRLTGDTTLASAGYYQLTWRGQAPADDKSWRFELEESGNAGFADSRMLYRGRDTARVVSGKPDGMLFYRVRVVAAQAPGPWSDTLKVEVQHHSLARAFTLFAVGLAVFIATVALIVTGTLRTRRAG
jgi:hypothetical protein